MNYAKPKQRKRTATNIGFIQVWLYMVTSAFVFNFKFIFLISSAYWWKENKLST